MDFVSDSLFNGRRIRALTIVDNFSRECLAIHVDHSISADKVVGVMQALKRFTGRMPGRMQGDKGKTVYCPLFKQRLRGTHLYS